MTAPSAKVEKDLEVGHIENPPKKSSWCGRHWTRIPIGVGIVLVIGGLASAIFGSSLEFKGAVGGGAVVVGLVLMCLGFCCRGRRLKKNVKKLGEQNKVFEKENLKFKRNIKKLQDVKKGLKSSLKTAKKAKNEIKKSLSKEVVNLDKVSNKLTETEKKLTSLQNLYKQFKDKTERVVGEIEKFNKKNKVIGEELSDIVDDIGEEEEKIDHEVDEFDGENEEMLQQNKELASLLGKLKGEVTTLQGGFDIIKKTLLDEIGSNVKILDVSGDKYHDGVKRIENSLNKVKEILDSSSDSDS